MDIIVCVDRNWRIGNGNKLLFHIPADMAFFKEKTLGKVVVMGRNTLLSLPDSKPLPCRENVILSSTQAVDGCEYCGSMDELKSTLAGRENVFVIGGEQVYRELLPYCKRAFVTKVDDEKIADCAFPNLDELYIWELVNQGEWQEYNEYRFCFCEYINNEVLEFG